MSELRIVRTAARMHRAYLVPDGGSTTTIPIVDYGDALPHDLVHYCVETALGLRWGFWGLAFAGAQFDVVRAATARNPRGAIAAEYQDPLIADHLDELLEAEALVADPPAQAQPLLDDVHDRWRSLAVGETLMLAWP